MSFLQGTGLLWSPCDDAEHPTASSCTGMASEQSVVQLTSLPPDALDLVLIAAGRDRPADLASCACACRALHAAAAEDAVWREMFAARYAALLSSGIFSEVPPPPLGASWRDHHLTFGATFMSRAKEHGKLCLVIDGLGIPPPRMNPLWMHCRS